MKNRLEIGQSVEIKKGTELNHGLDEDSDSIVVKKGTQVVIVSLAHLNDGGVEIVMPGHEDLSPLFWHQPEVSRPPRSQSKRLPLGS
jgi:hypothetical protein